MKQDCPHCGEHIEQLENPEYGHGSVGDDIELWLEGACPHCKKPVSIHTSGRMHADEVPTKDDIVEEIADAALEKVHYEGNEDVEYAVRQATSSIQHEYAWFDHQFDYQNTIGMVLAHIAEQTPDEWHGEIAYDHDADHPYRLTNVTPCPECGQKDIFNVTVKEFAQMVVTDDGDFLPDDIHPKGAVRVTCNSCGEVVLDEESA